MKYSTLNIFIFAHSRRKYIQRILQELTQVDPQVLMEIKVILLIDHFGQSGILPIIRLLRDNNVKYSVVARRRYLDKSRVMSKSKSRLIMKLDEDIFMTAQVWERFLKDCFENMPLQSVLAPVISSGIPGVESFLTTFSDKAFADQFRKKLGQIKIPNAWGANYESLLGKYNSDSQEDFFAAVHKINHHYKGVHPLRFSEELQMELVNQILENSSWREPLETGEINDSNDFPYFCNSAFVTSASIYREVIEGLDNGVYFNDGFDEVALNQHLERSGRPLIFNGTTAAIHPSYNTIGPNYVAISDHFFGSI